MKEKKNERVTFKSLDEFDRAFFPAHLKEKEDEAQEQVESTTRAAEIAEQVLSSIAT